MSVKLDGFAIWLQLESAHEKCFRLSHQWTEIHTVYSYYSANVIIETLSLQVDISLIILQIMRHVRIKIKYKYIVIINVITFRDRLWHSGSFQSLWV